MNGAKYVVSQILKAPASASWNNISILEKDEFNRYLVRVTVDAQNSYGAILRAQYLVVLRMTDVEQFIYSQEFAAMEIKGDYEMARKVQMIKEMNSWGKEK